MHGQVCEPEALECFVKIAGGLGRHPPTHVRHASQLLPAKRVGLSVGLFLRQLRVTLGPADDSVRGDDDRLQKRAALRIVRGSLRQEFLRLADDRAEALIERLFIIHDQMPVAGRRARAPAGRQLALHQPKSFGMCPVHIVAQRPPVPVVPHFRGRRLPRLSAQMIFRIRGPRRQPRPPLPHDQLTVADEDRHLGEHRRQRLRAPDSVVLALSSSE